MKRIIKSLVLVSLLAIVASRATLAAFTSEGKVGGNFFSTGHADLALLKDLALPPVASNLTQNLAGFVFNDISDNWQQRVGVKVANTGSLDLQTVLAAQSLDPLITPSLKDAINVKIFRWFDNGDGVVQAVELGSETETKTISFWLNSPFTLGVLPAQQVAAYAIQFEVQTLDNSYQGKESTVDFVFDATTTE